MKWNIENQPISFPKKIREIYDEIYHRNRIFYCEWIQKLTKDKYTNLDWWMTRPTLRNPYTSNLINYITVFETLKKIKTKDLEIVTNSKNMGLLLNKYFSRKFNLVIKYESKMKNNKILIIFKSFLFQIFIFTYLKLFIKKNKINPKNKITLIDTFITINESLNLGFYPPLKNKKKNEILFAPTIFQSFKLFKLTRNIKKQSLKNFIFKEHYLSFYNLFYAFCYIFRRKKFLSNKYYFKNYNLSEIVNEEILSYQNFNSIVTGILNYKFFENISSLNLNVCKSVNWFENQVIDRGWNLGFRTFYKSFEKNSFGYQNFTRHYNLISFSPSKFEYLSKVTPYKIITISKYFKSVVKEFYKKQSVVLGPTSRFKNSKGLKKFTLKKKEGILLVLSGIYKIDKALVKLVTETCNNNHNLSIIVKEHPIMPLKKITSFRQMPENFKPVNGNLNLLLKKSLMTIISGPTSAILESYYMNNILILPNIEVGTKINAARLKIDKGKFFVVENENELSKSINYIKKNKFKLLNRGLKNFDFFEELNKNNIKIFN
tara:strand:- start:2125 stop:3759 length:1635 start_codon:yes stop_codon:yes gene_type:complete